MDSIAITELFVCPKCHGGIQPVDDQASLGNPQAYVCMECCERFGVRDEAPVLIYPPPDEPSKAAIYFRGVDGRPSFIRRASKLFFSRVADTGWISTLWMIPTYLRAQVYNRLLVFRAKSERHGRVTCSCCGWSGSGFGVYWDPSEVIDAFECPVCAAHPRHRFFALHLAEWIDLDGGVTLHAAPEPALERLFGRSRRLRVTTDYEMAGVDCLSNLCHLPFADGTLSGVICSHVLEHIEDDVHAMAELFRVLRPGGTAVICVPEGNHEQTVEFGFPDPRKTYHWRDYGRDVVKRLETVGFRVRTTTPETCADDLGRFGLSSGERVHLCARDG